MPCREDCQACGVVLRGGPTVAVGLSIGIAAAVRTLRFDHDHPGASPRNVAGRPGRDARQACHEHCGRESTQQQRMQRNRLSVHHDHASSVEVSKATVSKKGPCDSCGQFLVATPGSPRTTVVLGTSKDEQSRPLPRPASPKFSLPRISATNPVCCVRQRTNPGRQVTSSYI